MTHTLALVPARTLSDRVSAAVQSRLAHAGSPADAQSGTTTDAQAELHPEAGMTTAEYAVGTVAACGFGGVLYKVVTSPQILDIIKSVIGKAFHLSF